MANYRAGIIGAAGYTGGELIRLLLLHPEVDIAFAQSNSQAGKPVHDVHNDLLGDTALLFSAEHHFDIDVLFFCSGHGEARKFVEKHEIHPSIRLIDLGNDFRLSPNCKTDNHEFVYGLPELNRQKIASAFAVANPGCFATAIQLALLPLAKAGMLADIYTTGITGSTGAGQALSATSHFSWRANNIQAYKTLTHQHNSEIIQSLIQLQTHDSPLLHFVPWRGDFTRGIFASSMINTSLALDELNQLYLDYYQQEPFTHVSPSATSLKQVVNTNKCVIGLEKNEETLVIHSAIDNLVKGASGQAIQNMNIMLGLPEIMGLQLKPSAF